MESKQVPGQDRAPTGLPLAAKLFIGTIIIAGAAGAIVSLHGWTPQLSVQLFVYLAITLLTSGMVVTFPGIKGSMSVNYIFTLLALVQFDWRETMLLAQVAVIAQLVWRGKRWPRMLHLGFNVASITLTVLAATFFYHRDWFSSLAEGQFLRLIIAGFVYFVWNVGSVQIIVALSERSRRVAFWKEFYSFSLPFSMVGATLVEMVHLSIDRLGWTFTVALVPFLYAIYRSYKLAVTKIEQEKEHAENVAALHLRTIEALAMAIEAKDECTHEHLRRVQTYSLKTAEHLGLSEDEIRALEAASILHDIGKLAVPDYIISKPGKLTPQEFEKMKVHTVVGARILEQVGFPYHVPPIVRSHHEKWDGSGYPDGLSGDDIPIGARILSAVDCLDALASDRPYRRALPLEEAMDYVASLAGRSFDPQIVGILKNHYREFEALAREAKPHEMLDTHQVITRGAAPDAGFEKDDASLRTASAGEASFAKSIASARLELQAIVELTQDLGANLKLEEVLAVIAVRLKRLLPYDCIAIYVREGGVLRPKYVNGEESRTLQALEIPTGMGISGWVVEQRQPIINGDPSAETAHLNDPTRLPLLKSALSAPLIGEQIAGALTLYGSERDAYNKDHLRLLQAVNGKISRVLERAIRSERAGSPDTLDELTGLPNAKSLHLRLEEEIARSHSEQKRFTLMVCDLDGFKYVNDNLGKFTGNELIKEAARILRDNCRDTDYIARMGADQFFILLPGATPEEIDGRIKRLDREILLASAGICREQKVGISVGLACFPDDGTHPEILLSHADNDMYRTKRARKSGNVVRLARPAQVA